MKTNHTPGPWYMATCNGKPSYDRIFGDSGIDVCQMLDIWEDPFPNYKANAKLIAAAPDLLEACMMAMQDTIMLLDETAEFTPENLKSTIEALSNAIKKATE